MMCYRDKTFCPYGLLCKDSGNCDRVLTPQVQKDADAWWGKPGAPIMIYADFPKCFVRFFETGGEIKPLREGTMKSGGKDISNAPPKPTVIPPSQPRNRKKGKSK